MSKDSYKLGLKRFLEAALGVVLLVLAWHIAIALFGVVVILLLGYGFYKLVAKVFAK